ncbi:MAG: cupredoxin domain-containing protein [Actinomycetota bacterium]
MTDEQRTPATPSKGPRESLLLPIAIPLGLLAGIGIVLWGLSRVLLRVEPKVATVTALLVATSIVTIVGIAASRARVTNGSLLSVVAGVFGVAMLLSGAALLAGQASGETGVAPVSVALAAPKGAAATGYDLKTLSAPADTAFTIAFNNQDPGVQHNVMVASADPAKDPAAQIFLDGTLVTGPGAFDYAVPALPAGEYVYFCKIHPTTMKGVLTVAVGAAPGTGASGNVISAANLAFDRDTLSFPAGTASTLTFQNDEAGVPHNVAIYTDESASVALFQGELVTGVASADYAIPALDAGSYFFRCDVHPTMNGTVTVGGKGGGPSSGPSSGSQPPPTESATPPPSSSAAPPPSGGVTVTAAGLAFDPTAISLPASKASTITLDNQEVGVAHNISIYTDDTYATALFTGDFVTGVSTQVYDIPALDPGSYVFRCDAHPTTMTGTVTVG